MKISNISLAAILVIASYTVPAQMLRTSGTKIVDDSGNEIILKGLNTNNWLLQEGYMMETGGAQWEIEEQIDDVVGLANREVWYERWMDNYFTKADIDSMKSWGFNSVRAPFHYKWLSPLDTPGVFYEDGFVRLDSLVSWCAQNEMWCILDMHAAPGGQGKNKEISDYNPALPGLYESTANQDKFVEIWLELAKRYKNNPWVGGYDLINEPNWEVDDKLFAHIYQRAISAVRTVDTNHIIFVEGNWFATSFGTDLRDTIKRNSNVAWSFHKYWNGNDGGSIGYILDMRDQDQMPLWLGETGENSNQWFIELVELCETHDIGWAWWGTKKIESISAIFEVPRPATYASLTSYWNSGGTQPSTADALQGLNDLADSSLNQHNTFNMDMVYSLVGYPGGAVTYPYKDHYVPGSINATDFDMGPIGEAMYDVDYANFGSGFYNRGFVYRNSGIDIGGDSDQEANGYHVGWTEASEWMKYTVNVDSTGWYQVEVRAASDGDGKFVLSSDSGTSGTISMPFTGGFNAYSDINAGFIYLNKGVDEFYFTVLESGFDFNKITLTYFGPLEGVHEMQSNYDILLSPNPAVDQIRLTGEIPSDTYSLRITDFTGREIYGKSVNSGSKFNQTINFTSLKLTPGFYVISIVGEKGVTINKRFYKI